MWNRCLDLSLNEFLNIVNDLVDAVGQDLTSHPKTFANDQSYQRFKTRKIRLVRGNLKY